MIAMELLRKHVKERRIPASVLSEAMGVSISTYYRLMESNGEKITVEQSQTLKNMLSLSNLEYAQIFYPKTLNNES